MLDKQIAILDKSDGNVFQKDVDELKLAYS